MLRFADLRLRLIASVREKVRSGEMTERGLARLTKISQPHIHNVLKGKKLFSLEVCDIILQELHLDIFDLVGPAEVTHRGATEARRETRGEKRR
jgi:hypothetical protein